MDLNGPASGSPRFPMRLSVQTFGRRNECGGAGTWVGATVELWLDGQLLFGMCAEPLPIVLNCQPSWVRELRN